MIELEGVEPIYQSIAMILALLVAIIGHEIMHGYVAYRYGDNTAKNAGRLSVNPIIHIDPIGSILVPGLLYFSGAPFLFGWAKPVPVDNHVVLQNGGYNAIIAVSLAGIAYNFALALTASILLEVVNIDGFFAVMVALFLLHLTIYNVVLGVFNLWPIPPLDGSHALSYLCLKYRFYALPNLFERVGGAGMILIVLVLATPLSDYFFYPVRAILGYLL